MTLFLDKYGIPLLLGVVILAAGAAYLVKQKQDNQLLCEAANDNRAVVRNLLLAARSQTPKAERTRRARRFYSRQLRRLVPLNCSEFNRDSLSPSNLRKRQGGDASSAGKPHQPP